MSDEPRPVGRPTKYDPSLCDALIACMSKGFSLTAFAGEIGVSRSTINNWMGEHPEFLEATKNGQAARTRILEATLLAAETGPKVTAHIFALKNASPEEWRDKHEVQQSGGLSITISSDDANL
jgi:transcriptional regulator with XRE-family HTH domain